ncbi:MAG: type II toxin-antitoxin system PemK/MazF family toxin [bacterium]
MDKDFDYWNDTKKKVHLILPPHFKERDIWWCIFGVNVGVEIDGKGEFYTRPAVIIRKINNHGCYVVPLTTQSSKDMLEFSLSVGVVDEKPAYANITQVRAISSKRLEQRIGTLNNDVFDIIKKSARDFMFPADLLHSPLSTEGQPEGDIKSIPEVKF